MPFTPPAPRSPEHARREHSAALLDGQVFNRALQAPCCAAKQASLLDSMCGGE
jgi:hypothetical protein